MGSISFLKRLEETTVPSLPLAPTITPTPFGTATSLMPAINVFVWVPCVSMRMVLASPATPALPISILLSPVVRFPPAKGPNAMLLLPVVLLRSALAPLATFLGAGRVVTERIETVGRVVLAAGIAKERIISGSRVVAAGGVGVERIKTIGLHFGTIGAGENCSCSTNLWPAAMRAWFDR